ncbi:bis(5'-adenosyl)-triphosphatase [Ascoidea rubescens DSM 1968]|uniref:Bis(5'-adenosyl)-triphosphatase n=1 Tax=Ascoidea rubescens DSM 1968 TaxID=1344418 RepID=A0A1D2VLB5_9ASCO|nr:HIT-like protein [Ascoidea rubescens DSM 1968]ODV62327.1 HIT-like protein [Ascoidea rubescens DSM 1968]
MTNKGIVYFSKFPVTSQVFYRSNYSFALVNLKPIVPGHVLVCPLRVVARLKELTSEESVDFILTVQKIHEFIEKMYKADALNISIQDGPSAGQSVPHLHAHIIPRYKKDEYGDGIYDKLDQFNFELSDILIEHQKIKIAKEKNYDPNEYKRKQMVVSPDIERKPRSMEVMENEAKWLENELRKFKLVQVNL